MEILKKNLSPVFLIERVVNSYITVNVPWVPFPLHLYFSFSYLTSAIFLSSLRNRFVTKSLSRPIALIWISNYLVSSNLFGVKDPYPWQASFAWFISLHVWAVMAVMSAKQPGIFPQACVSTFQSVIRLLTFSNIYRILNIVVSCVQQTVSIFQITPLQVSNLR